MLSLSTPGIAARHSQQVFISLSKRALVLVGGSRKGGGSFWEGKYREVMSEHQKKMQEASANQTRVEADAKQDVDKMRARLRQAEAELQDCQSQVRREQADAEAVAQPEFGTHCAAVTVQQQRVGAGAKL